MSAPRPFEVSPAQERYLGVVATRARRADAAVLSRLIGVQVAWAITLVAGAAVSLVQAFGAHLDWVDRNAGWLTALLGFVVVVAQGATRLMGRTSTVVQADDQLRRGLARERRLFDAGAAPYASTDDPFGRFVERVESLMSDHDQHAATYTTSLLRSEA